MKKNTIEKKYIILIIIFVIMLILVILSYGLKRKKNLNAVEAIVKDVIVSVENIVFYPFRFVVNNFEDYKELKNVKKENDYLKNSIDKLKSIETENIELRKEIESLKEELDISYVLTDYDNINASVVSRNINYWYNTITINKGKKNGIKEEMPVINGSGLIGKVVSVTNYTSTVKLITTSDTSNKISVTIISNNEKVNGLINGYDLENGLLKVEGISNTKSVKVGDIVYTSGLGGIFPSGILIGKVEEITTDNYDLSKIINVIPSADFDNINYVSILKRKENNE